MTHARQKIREAVASVLASTPTTWSQVRESRVASLRQIWPYLMVFAEGEASSVGTTNLPCVYLRSLTLAVIGMLRLPGSGDTQTIEDKMDAMAEEVETKLTNASLRAVSGMLEIESISLSNTAMDVAIDEEGAMDHAEVQMTFVVVYAVLEGVPATII
jgi:hypothetical protein